MKTNDCLRRLRYILDIDENKMASLFAQANQKVAPDKISAWLKKDDDPKFAECSDRMFAAFLNGLINDRRGKREGTQPEPEDTLNNNIVFRKLKIAFDLQAEDILEILMGEDVDISKHELSAFFRRPGHKHYRECKDQVLRNFLGGLGVKFRGI